MFVYSRGNVHVESCIPIKYFDGKIVIDEKIDLATIVDRFVYERTYTNRRDLPIEIVLLTILYRDFLACFDVPGNKCGWTRVGKIKIICDYFAKFLDRKREGV